jgi:hypothetical protein
LYKDHLCEIYEKNDKNIEIFKKLVLNYEIYLSKENDVESYMFKKYYKKYINHNIVNSFLEIYDIALNLEQEDFILTKLNNSLNLDFKTIGENLNIYVKLVKYLHKINKPDLYNRVIELINKNEKINKQFMLNVYIIFGQQQSFENNYILLLENAQCSVNKIIFFERYTIENNILDYMMNIELSTNFYEQMLLLFVKFNCHSTYIVFAMFFHKLTNKFVIQNLDIFNSSIKYVLTNNKSFRNNEFVFFSYFHMKNKYINVILENLTKIIQIIINCEKITQLNNVLLLTKSCDLYDFSSALTPVLQHPLFPELTENLIIDYEKNQFDRRDSDKKLYLCLSKNIDEDYDKIYNNYYEYYEMSTGGRNSEQSLAESKILENHNKTVWNHLNNIKNIVEKYVDIKFIGSQFDNFF